MQFNKTRVTFQIGIRAGDGVILASDTRVIQQGKIRTSSDSSKYFSGSHIACCSSGTENAEDVADYCVRNFNPLIAIDEQIERACRVMFDAMRSRGGDPGRFYGGVLTAHCDGKETRLWTTSLRQLPDGKTKSPVEVSTYEYIGDNANSAVFIAEKYIRPAILRRSSKRDMVFIAAHTVLMAGEINPSTVGGLEIFLCDSSGFNRLSEDEITELSRRSAELDAEISRRLFSTHL
jgi:20S proteasome alpha/beta subunit